MIDPTPFVQTIALEKLTKLLAAENITIQHSHVSTAFFDTKNRILMLPYWKNMTEVKYRLLTTHEVGHALETKDADWKKHSSDPKRLNLMNVLEDARIESLMKKRFPGVRSDFFKGYKEFFEEDFFGVKAAITSPKKFKQVPFISRMNLHAKIGAFVDVPFSSKEKPFVARMMALSTFREMEVLMEDILRFIAENKKAEEKKAAEKPAEEPKPTPKPPETPPQPQDESDSQEDDAKESGENSAPDEADEQTEETDDSAEQPQPSENEDDSDESDEEEKNSSSSDNESDEDDDEDESDSNETSDEGGESDGEFNSSDANEETQESFDNNLDKMRDRDAAPPHYIKIPENYDLKDIVLSWRHFLEMLRVEDSTKRLHLRPRTATKFQKFMAATNPVVSYMIKEFETKKSADRFSRQRTAKTGVINPSKLHSYKTESDIFRRLTVLPEDKNHGLVMFIDFSSSMWSNLEGTMMQLLNLVVFCRKLGIPHRVFAFTDGAIRVPQGTSMETADALNRILTHRSKDEAGFITLTDNLKIIELFSEKMKNQEFVDMARLLLFISESSTHASSTFALGGTPLYETMVVARKIIKNFRAEIGSQIVNTVFLTDGEGQSIRGLYTDGSGYSVYGMYDTIIIDPQTKRQATCKNPQDVASFLMVALQDVTGTQAVNFRIEGGPKRCAEKVMQIINGKSNNQYASKKSKKSMKTLREDATFDKVYTTLKNDKVYAISNGEGYAEYYMICGGDDLKTEANTFNTSVSSGESVGKISSAFMKANRGRGTSRVLLANFIKLIA